VHDGVDILNLSVGPDSPPSNTKTTFLNPFDATLLGAVKAGVFVAQAAGNGGPFPKSLVSYSPWIATVAAAIDDRRYKNHLILENGKILAGIGLSRKFSNFLLCFLRCNFLNHGLMLGDTMSMIMMETLLIIGEVKNKM